MNSKPPHLLAAYILVDTTGVIYSALLHRSERRLVSVASQLVARHKFKGVVSSSHHDQVGGKLDGAMAISMPDSEGPRLGRRAVHRDPLCVPLCVHSSNEQDSAVVLYAAVVPPFRPGVRQVVPLAIFVDLATVTEAVDQLAGDEVCSRASHHPPWIVLELAAPFLGVVRRPELNGGLSCIWI